MIALAGAHRSGKTTLAKGLAQVLGVEFLETKVGDVFANLGLDPKSDLPFADRLKVQNEILRSLEVQYQLRQDQVFIADRSPFDVLGYTMADIKRDSLDDVLREQILDHVDYAIRIVTENLRGVMIVCPLSGMVDAPGKAQACPLYMHHVYVCIKDMIANIGDGIDEFHVNDCDLTEHPTRMAQGIEFVEYLQSIYKPEVKLWTPGS